MHATGVAQLADSTNSIQESPNPALQTHLGKHVHIARVECCCMAIEAVAVLHSNCSSQMPSAMPASMKVGQLSAKSVVTCTGCVPTVLIFVCVGLPSRNRACAETRRVQDLDTVQGLQSVAEPVATAQ